MKFAYGLYAVLLISVGSTFAADPMPDWQKESNPPPTVAETYEKAANLNDASFVTELSFAKGSTTLTADAQSQLKDVLKAAQAKGKIAEVKVLAWADKEYPKRKSNTLDRDQRKLADERSLEVKGFFDDATPGLAVNRYNMAERPNLLAKLLRANDARVKRSLETAGLVHPEQANMPTKASKALVMVILQ